MTINSEYLTALVFFALGGVAVVTGWGYGFGSFAALGSGAMPVLVGGALCLLGLVQALRTWIAERRGARFAAAFARAEARPLAVVLAAVAAFGLLIGPFGLIPALVALIGIGWFAEKGGRRRELAAVMLVVIALIVVIFRLGLGIPFRLFVWGV